MKAPNNWKKKWGLVLTSAEARIKYPPLFVNRHEQRIILTDDTIRDPQCLIYIRLMISFLGKPGHEKKS